MIKDNDTIRYFLNDDPTEVMVDVVDTIVVTNAELDYVITLTGDVVRPHEILRVNGQEFVVDL